MIISISGRIGHGKDEVAKIIQYLTSRGSKGSYASFSLADSTSSWHIKKFADKLKDITCLLLGCTREQLEDREFKESELGPEWDCWMPYSIRLNKFIGKPYSSLEQCADAINVYHTIGVEDDITPRLRKMTYRLFTVLIGKEFGRDIIHPNIWVTSLMKEYKPTIATILSDECPVNVSGTKNYFEITEDNEVLYGSIGQLYPDWVISDTRFPNELEAIKIRSGVCIKVVRDSIPTPLNEHESETALDAASFDYMINNNGSLEDLVESVRQILLDLNIISK